MARIAVRVCLGGYRAIRALAGGIIGRLPGRGGSLGSWLVECENRLPVRSLILRSAPNPVILEGYKFHYRPKVDDAFLWPAWLKGRYEPETTQAFRRTLVGGMAVADLGAHIGYFSLLAAGLVGPSGRVYAFEPAPGTFEILERNIKANGAAERVTAVRAAVADRRGQAALFNASASSFSPSLHAPPGTPSAAVPATTLDIFFSGLGWPRVDLVKMDIEGSELAALRGMKELRRRNPSLKLILEVHLAHVSASGSSVPGLLAALRQNGFQVITALAGGLPVIRTAQDAARLERLARAQVINLLAE